MLRKLSYHSHHMSLSIINYRSIATAAFSLLYIKRNNLTVFDKQVQRLSRGAVFLVGNTFEARQNFRVTPSFVPRGVIDPSCLWTPAKNFSGEVVADRMPASVEPTSFSEEPSFEPEGRFVELHDPSVSGCIRVR